MVTTQEECALENNVATWNSGFDEQSNKCSLNNNAAQTHLKLFNYIFISSEQIEGLIPSSRRVTVSLITMKK